MPKRILTILLLLAATPAVAQSPTPQPGTVSTAATARAHLPNTVADAVLGIESHSTALADVQSALATNATQLSAYLATVGARETRTQDISIQPERDPKPAPGQPPRIVGYTGHVAVSLQIDAAQLGPALAGALTHGANTIDQTNLHPRQAEIDARRTGLAADATRTAIDQARAVATAAGRTLGPIRSLVVQSQQPQGTRPMMLRAMAPTLGTAAPIAIDAGETEIAATVNVTIALIEP